MTLWQDEPSWPWRVNRLTLEARMLSDDLIRKFLDDPSLTDDQVEDIRSVCHALAEVVFVAWRNGQLEKKSSSEAATDSTFNSGGL